MTSAAALWCLSLLAGRVVSSPLGLNDQYQQPFSSPYTDSPVGQNNDMVILDLLAKYAPIFKLSELEAFFPSSVNYMFPHYNFTESPSGEIQHINHSLITRSHLDQLPSSGQGLFLSINEDHNPQPFLEEESEYLFGPYGRENETRYEDGRGRLEEEVYGFGVDRGGGIVDLWYWTFYPFNFGKPVGPFGILGNHVADWEHLRMRTVNGTAISADYTTHTGGRFSAGTYRWEDIEKIDGRPVAYVAAGSHGVGKLFKLVDITDDEGPIWDTKSHVVPAIYWNGPESRAKLRHNGDLSWLNYRGKWGNKGETDCWWHRIVGYCQVVDAPWGPNRGFGIPPECIIAPLTKEFSTYKFKFASNVLDWAKSHNIELVKIEQICTRPKTNPDDPDDPDDPDELDIDMEVYEDEVEGWMEVQNVKSIIGFRGSEKHSVTLNPCKGRRFAVRAYKLSLCLLNGRCLSTSNERKICTYDQNKRGHTFGSAVDLDDIDEWRWDY
ncbi:hypothetical protein I302_107757 [Kwoniella bestiolae CBS 10118]|uniref:Vacuolar protein sorting-associated protein 62 n=1 Tax=Kwoniella bestiolae CBS 10118 TaxID=1296100 RepID=A0A1B9FXN6_9TREE|nr:hypothetical protein I302_06504 [Kwoniella bestiolae CBS 10118]OCF23521.1 hypothetical protein I302_06504 [Kwoniella bestiolae CBS 10118]